MNVVGIAIAKDSFEVALTQDNVTYKTASFVNQPKGHLSFLRWLARQTEGQVHLCLEATGRYGEALADTLFHHGYLVSVVNPFQIFAYGKSKLRRNKNDKLDAQLIADFCFTQTPPLWMAPSQSQRELKELTRHINTLKEDRQRKRNQLNAGVSSRRLRQSIEETIRFLEQEIEQLEKEMEKLLRSDEQSSDDFELLLSIPGIGVWTAACFLAEVDVFRFDKASQLAAYAGLAPREHTSGASVHKKAVISKVGNTRLRTAFFMPALSAHRFNPIIHALRQRLLERNKPKMAVVTAVMRKLLTLAYGVLKTRKPFDPNHAHPTPVLG
jgi:transposase